MRIRLSRNMRARAITGVLVVSAVTASVSLVDTQPLHADSVVSHVELYKAENLTAPPPAPLFGPADPTCTRIPGIRRFAKVWVDTYVSLSLGRYNGLKWFFNTTYRKALGAIKESYKLQYGKEPTCAWLNAMDTFDNSQEPQALRLMACQNPYRNPAVTPTRWCQIMSRIDSKQAVPSTVDLKTEQCREPQWNNGSWGPMGWASWHNQHVKLDTTDILQQLGLGWVPGHFNIDTYAEDLDQLAGVSNVNFSTLQPNDNAGRWIGYGKVQTAPASELWVRFFDAVARAKGVNPVTSPVYAHDTVAKNAIANNALLTINLYPDIAAKSKWITVRVGDYRRDLFKVVCAFSPWLQDTLGDTNGPRIVIPTPVNAAAPNGQCDAGFTMYRPASSGANGYSFLKFTQAYSPDNAKDLKGHEQQQSQIVQEMFNNLDRVNPMLLKSPIDTDAAGHVILNCHIERNLGVSRGTKDVNVRDPHFAHFFRG